MAKKLMVANWKMNPSSAKEAKKLLSEYARLKNKNSDIVVCPPFPYFPLAKASLALGAQDVFWEAKGAYTGEVSVQILKSWKVGYIIVGHSERRGILGETDEIVNKKLQAVFRGGLKAILCVGEPMEVRKRGSNEAKKFVLDEIRKDLVRIPPENYKSLVIAYEPIWSISTSGTGEIDTPEDVSEMVRHIKSVLPVKVIYGGSVNAKNAKGFLERGEIDGLLIGSASLDMSQMKKIVESTK